MLVVAVLNMRCQECLLTRGGTESTAAVVAVETSRAQVAGSALNGGVIVGRHLAQVTSRGPFDGMKT